MTERIDRFIRLMAAYQQTPDDYDREVEEDVRPYFRDGGAEDLYRYVAVTRGGGDGKVFFYPVYAQKDDAIARCVEFAEDDIYAEIPVEVHDLDSGCSFLPNWGTLQFEPEPGPCAGSQCR